MISSRLCVANSRDSDLVGSSAKYDANLAPSFADH